MTKHIENTVIRSEEWQQKNGEGILEIRGGELDIVLVFNDVPQIYDAFDCEGSIGRFLVMLADENPLEANQLVTQAAASGFADPAPLHEQIAPLLRLLPNGNYHLKLEQVHNYGADLFSDYVWESEKPDTLWYYPDYAQQQTLSWTQSELTLDNAMINRYMALIDSGQRPALITIGLRNNGARFIIDGHHKQIAYWCCGVGPYTLHIEFQDAKAISKELAQKSLGYNSRAQSYLKVKARTIRPDRSR